jgi:hypothetical protein
MKSFVAASTIALVASASAQQWNETDNGLYDVSAQPNANKTPGQIHINQWTPSGGWRSNNAATLFKWVTGKNYDCAPTVQIAPLGDSSSAVNISAKNVSTQFMRHANTTFNVTAGLLGDSPTVDLEDGKMVTYISPYIHKVIVQGLSPNTEYEYKLGAECEEDPEAWSSEWITYVTPKAGGQEGGQTLAIMGDIGQTQYSAQTVENALQYLNNESVFFPSWLDGQTSWKPDSVMIVGDLAYADGDAGLRWDTYEQMISPLTSQVPTFVMPGKKNTSFYVYM